MASASTRRSARPWRSPTAPRRRRARAPRRYAASSCAVGGRVDAPVSSSSSRSSWWPPAMKRVLTVVAAPARRPGAPSIAGEAASSRATGAASSGAGHADQHRRTPRAAMFSATLAAPPSTARRLWPAAPGSAPRARCGGPRRARSGPASCRRAPARGAGEARQQGRGHLGLEVDDIGHGGSCLRGNDYSDRRAINSGLAVRRPVKRVRLGRADGVFNGSVSRASRLAVTFPLNQGRPKPEIPVARLP